MTAARSAGTPLVLASASPRRRDLLAQIGFVPDAIDPPALDEALAPRELPDAYAARIARDKARTVAARHAGAIVLAADTVVACGRRVLPKAETAQEATLCLMRLSGRRHRVFGGVCIVGPDGAEHARIVRTIVRFKRLTTAEIDAYIACGEWHGKAGGYAIQGRAAAWVAMLNGSYSNVVGLPLHETYQLLTGLGLRPGPSGPARS